MVRARTRPIRSITSPRPCVEKYSHWVGITSKSAAVRAVKGRGAAQRGARAKKTLAQALMNAQHTVSAADKPKVEAITKDPAASEALKTLAGVLAKLQHTPSEADKQALTNRPTAKYDPGGGAGAGPPGDAVYNRRGPCYPDVISP